MEYIINALLSIFSPLGFLMNLVGVVLGIVFGALPGLNGVVGVALLLPLTYNMAPHIGLIMLAGLYMGATYGGSISAILLNCPGTGEAACTAINGNPLALQGKAKEALSYSVISSSFGALFGVIVMLLFTPVLAKFALRFGPPEQFLVCVMGLSVVGSLMGESVAKGFFAVSFGLILALVGMDPTSVNYRLTFGQYNLQMGLDLIPISVGFFAIAEMLALYKDQETGELITDKVSKFKVVSIIKDTIKRWKIVVKSSVIGTVIGILPGTGGAIASFIAYGEAQRSSKERHLFGKGAIDGIIAPESANNAAVGGSFVPLLALGIPGSATSAIIFGALTVHGMIPGPRLFSEHTAIVYALMFGLLLSVFLIFFIGISGTRLFTKILTVNTKYIVPAVIAFSLFGAYSARNNLFDVFLAIIFGVIGLLFKRTGIPIAPAILGMILGKMAEQNLRQSMVIAKAKAVPLITYILVRPISIILIVLILLIIWGNLKTSSKGTE